MAIALPRMSEGTDRFADFEDGIYELAFLDMEEDSGQYGPQYKIRFELPEVLDQDGKPQVLRTWLNQKLTPPPKASNLYILLAALLGRDITIEDELDDRMLRGTRCQARVALNDKGYPRIDNATYTRLRRAGQRPATPPPAPAPAAPAPVAATPASAPQASPMTERTVAKIKRLMAAEDLGDEAVNTHCAARFNNADWPSLTEAEGQELAGHLAAGEIAPF